MIFNIFYFVLPFVIGVVLTPLLKMLSEKTGALNDIATGDELKIHKKPTSLLGGVAIGVAMVVSLMVFFPSLQMVYIVGGLCSIFFLGFFDDYFWKHVSTSKPMLKFLFLILLVALSTGFLFFAHTLFALIAGLLISLFFTFVGIFIVINAVNYQDGMDGLAGGLVVISLIGFLCLGLFLQNIVGVGLALIFLGAVAAFLVFNLPPAKIFMGDSGAYTLGFILSLLLILFVEPFNFWVFVALVFILGVPIFDGVFTNIRRIMNGKSIFIGDRSHFYDKLLQKGFSVQKTLIICYSLQILCVVLGLIIYSYGRTI